MSKNIQSNIPQINVLDAFVEGDALGGAEGGERRWWGVGKTVAGEETGEVEWGVGQVVVDEPTAHLADHIEIVGELGDDEVGELDPDAGVAHGEDGVEDGLQTATADTTVEVVAEGFKVDVGGIEVGQQVG